MISYIVGKIKYSSENNQVCVLTDSGVGYSVLVSKALLEYYKNAQTTDKIELFIETKVRENDITLYGFFTEKEKWWFSKLTQVQGVGGKVALSVLDIGVSEINDAIYNKEISVLSLADGVGKRVAERIISELSKFCDVPNDSVSHLLEKQKVKEAVSKGLNSLGYNKTDFSFILDKKLQDNENLDSSAIIRDILVELGKD